MPDIAPSDRTCLLGGDPDAACVVPQDLEFGADEYHGTGFVQSQDLAHVGEMLIKTCPEFAHLAGIDVLYFWQRKGGMDNGQIALGRCKKTSGLMRLISGAEFLVTVSADHARERGLTNWQLEALLHHELCHADSDVDDKTGYTISKLRGHDWEGFTDNVGRYGLWDTVEVRAARAFEQLGLFGPPANPKKAKEPRAIRVGPVEQTAMAEMPPPGANGSIYDHLTEAELARVAEGR